jgi:hypothetical protein
MAARCLLPGPGALSASAGSARPGGLIRATMVNLYVKQHLFHDCFANDPPASESAVLAEAG